MVDFSNTTNRCILHVQGDLENQDYVELSTDNYFNEEEFIAIYRYLYKAMEEQIDLYDLNSDDDFGDEDSEEESLELNRLDNSMHKFFAEIGLSEDTIKCIIDLGAFHFIPSDSLDLVRYITNVNLYKIEDNHMYDYYDNGWHLIF